MCSLLLCSASAGFAGEAVWGSLNARVEGLIKQKRYSEALEVARAALDTAEARFGAVHRNTARSLYNLARAYHFQGELAEAGPLYKEALARAEKALGQSHPDLADYLSRLAILYHSEGDYAAADSFLERALAIREAALDRDHPHIALSRHNLGDLYHRQGRYRAAQARYMSALEINRANYGPDHPEVARTLNQLGLLYEDQGLYARAEPLYTRSLAIREKALGTAHPDVARALNNLAALYQAQGRYGEAEPLYRQALEIWEKRLGPGHPEVGGALNNLAALYLEQGRDAAAAPLFERALGIWEQALGPGHPDVAISLNNLAVCYRAQGRYADAESLYKRSLDIKEEVYGGRHSSVGLSRLNLAALYLAQGRYEEAEAHLKQAFRIVRQASRQTDLAVTELDVDVYALQAKLFRETGRPDRAVAALKKAIQAAEKVRPRVGGGEERRALFFERYSDLYDLMVGWLVKAGEIEEALEYAERGRSQALLDQLVSGPMRSGIPEEERAGLEAQEAEARARMAALQRQIGMARSRTNLPQGERRQRLGELERELRQVRQAYQQVRERKLNANRHWRNTMTRRAGPVDLFTVQSEMVPDAALMLLYQIGPEQSYVFVVPPEWEEPEVIPLTVSADAASVLRLAAGPLTADALMECLAGGGAAGLMARLGSHPRGLGLAAQGPGSAERLHALWQALVPGALWDRLAACEEVILVPDGALHLLPFEGLVVGPGEDGEGDRYWLDEGPAVRYAPSATVLYNIEQRAPAGSLPASGPVVLSLSDPVYDPVGVEQPSEKPAGNGLEGAAQAFNAGPPEGALTRSSFVRAGGSLARLPGTAREAEVIQDAFGQRKVVGLTQMGADEQHLRAALPGKRYLHLATHGLVDQSGQSLFAALALTPPVDGRPVSENDGFLRLYEIYGLELPECEVAVLSACQSNVGRYVEGEGVFALSRGFLAAGARRVVASQWPVDDASTAVLMEGFFRQVAAAEEAGEVVDYARALRDAKREVRNRDGWAASYYWAPFVLTGKR